MAEIISLKDAASVAPAPAELGGGGGPSGPSGQLPADCPVIPLGMSADGRKFYFLDSTGRLHVCSPTDLARAGMLALFNERWELLREYWPRLTKMTDKATGEEEWVVTGWKPERAMEEMIACCGRRGTLDIADKVRGPGAWKGRDGQLILHCGERVLFGREWRKPGEIDGSIYPAHGQTPLPSAEGAIGGAQGPAAEAKALFAGWQWKRPEIDPYLLLGALGAAKLGGALPWRPTTWITGEFNTGKSTLLAYFAALCGEGGVHITSNTTAAGVWQTAKHSSHPVLIDEGEAEADGRRMAGMIRLARDAASGSVIVRGGADHGAVQFTIRCCFLFSSILIPPLTPQDRSRITILELDELKGIKPPAISAAKLKAMGEALTRRLMDGWERLPALFEIYREALAAAGHRARGADQYGVVLACADLMLNDRNEPHSDELAEWCELLPAEKDTLRDHQNCVGHLLTAIVDPFRGGGRRTIAQWIGDAVAHPGPDRPDPLGEANRVLETYGLKVEIEAAIGRVGEPTLGHGPQWLHVANTHRGLAQLFEGSHWAGMSGTSSPWVQALMRVPGATRSWRRFAGYGARATRLPLEYLLRDEAQPE